MSWVTAARHMCRWCVTCTPLQHMSTLDSLGLLRLTMPDIVKYSCICS